MSMGESREGTQMVWLEADEFAPVISELMSIVTEFVLLITEPLLMTAAPRPEVSVEDIMNQ